MANDYLREVHAFLRRRIRAQQSRVSQNQTGGHPGHNAYYKGKLEEMQELRGFLSEHFDLTTHNYNR